MIIKNKTVITDIAGLDMLVKNKTFLNKVIKEILLSTKQDINQNDEGHFVPDHCRIQPFFPSL